MNLRKSAVFSEKSAFLGALCHLSFRHLKRSLNYLKSFQDQFWGSDLEDLNLLE